MKAFVRVLVIGSMMAVGWGCARSHPTPPTANRAPAPDPKWSERAALFGAEALAPDVTWTGNGLGYRMANPGVPPRPGIGDRVKLNYTGRLKDGTVFDRAAKPAEFSIGGTIAGLSAGLQLLGAGGRATFYIPPGLGYGPRKVMGIPPNSGLIFEVEVIGIER